MANYGWKGSKSSYVGHVTAATNKDLAFNSSVKHLIVRGKGKATSTTFNYSHELGYKPIFDAYMLTSGKHFLNYFQAPYDGGSFENTLYGSVYSDLTDLNADCATANRLIYICYLNPAGSIASATNPTAVGNVGMKMSIANEDVKTTDDVNLSLTSKYQSPMIIKTGTITVNVSAVGPTSSGTPIVRQTDYTDEAHGRSQANHVIMPDGFGAGALLYMPGLWGIVPTGYVATDVELSIDATNIRARVSRAAYHDIVFGAPISAAATTMDFDYYLTNIALPT